MPMGMPESGGFHSINQDFTRQKKKAGFNNLLFLIDFSGHYKTKRWENLVGTRGFEPPTPDTP
ncbi:hypothetical protein PANT111_170226 [Pantoea brenneri]|uniref:Uncharacterized protein n=1 Tax=Pantoea brenneri TaxID=472694 RepID=A0AAX3J5E6_9GAMM|nr:hypothetical protein PANT111_170226 [Pantoea brenneri]